MNLPRTIRFMLPSITLLLAASLPLQAQDSLPSDAPPAAHRLGWNPNDLPRWPSPVNPAAVVVEGGTEIRWMPEPFVFAPGASMRFIDFEGGDDANDGRTRDTAWKRHPWDPEAAGNAAGASGTHTYVFKGGVTYRGALVGRESGTAAEPIRLTRDPSWGEGPATLAGSVAVSSWRKATDEESATAGFPEAVRGQLWSATLPGEFIPRALWAQQPDGPRERVTLARWPNWKVEHPYNLFTQWMRVEESDQKFPSCTVKAPKVLNDPDPNAFRGATVWIDMPNKSGEFSIMGPFPSGVHAYDPASGSFQVKPNHPARTPFKNSPFFFENLPRFLDEPGEWWFDAQTRHLYLWPTDRQIPGQATLEAACHPVILELVGVRHVEVSGLAVTGGNCIDLVTAADNNDYRRADNTAEMAALRLTGDCRDIALTHLDIARTAGAGIVNRITSADDVVRNLRIADSRFEQIDNDGVDLNRGFAWARTESHPKGRLASLAIVRNRFHDIGMRCSAPQGGKGINLVGPELADIAGNVISRTAAMGINVVGGRGSGWLNGAAPDNPLTRIQIRQNQVTDTLLLKTDFGGIEFWGTGPAYVYNNLSINPVGYVAHRNVYQKNQAYYFDHGIKAYLFNCIGWSERRDDAWKGIVGDGFLAEVRTRWNQAFHNTAGNFRSGQSAAMGHCDQQHYLANLFVDCLSSSLSHWRLDGAAEIGYANNIVAGRYENVYSRWQGERHTTFASLEERLGSLPNLIARAPGWETDDMPVRDAEKRDFRLTDTSASIDRGVKVFVPWSLSGVVGEWHFRLHPKDPNTVLGYDLYPQKKLAGLSFNLDSPVPGNELNGSGFTAEHYEAGVLEDWVPGAARFDGQRRFTLANARLIQDIPLPESTDKPPRSLPGKERQTLRMETNNFLIEAVLRVEPDQKVGTIATKLDDGAGYRLGLDGEGRLALRLKAGAADATQTSRTALNDGRWHHVMAEVDRTKGTVALYVDGQDATGPLTGAMPPADASLDNAADFVVGEGLVGAMDFLRVARGTLADAETTIGELMSWQFNGPHLHDFIGRAPTGGIRDVGAIEHPTVSGQQTIRYTPQTTPVQPAAAAPPATPAPVATVEFKMGPDRTVQPYPWGSVSVPKEAVPGQEVDVQVVFGTEAMDKKHILRADLHGWEGPKRIGPVAHGRPVEITPGVTAPYTARMRVPKRAGLSAMAVVFYASPDGGWKGAPFSGDVAVKLLVQPTGSPP